MNEEQHRDEADRPPPEDSRPRREPAPPPQAAGGAPGAGHGHTPQTERAPQGPEGTVCNPDF
ncbi:MAG TPA: hypothetical protein VFW33_18065 [Gemmataceae bacterium]|nr:hypothetical protein [Gemmataceae bacterium]